MRVRIRGSSDLAELRPRSREAFLNAAEALTEARREQRTIAAQVEAMRERGIRVSRYAITRFFGHDLERGPGGWSVPRKADRSYHGDLLVISTEGLVARPVRGSRARSLIAAHANSVAGYLRGDDPDGEELLSYRGRSVAGVELETDLDRLDLLQAGGELDGFELYAEVAA
jgi:hypothetical protein